MNGLNHLGVRKSNRISRTLKLELRLINAARNVSSKHKKKIDTFSRAGTRATYHRRQCGDPECSQRAH
jgi:hypothetical protein